MSLKHLCSLFILESFDQLIGVPGFTTVTLHRAPCVFPFINIYKFNPICYGAFKLDVGS
ncbi:hypothetical protein Sjap_006600 [Stephania japonica]|uniref:Uncharacterized protein n=1 Tax=Stephania japonica TaxID=461633 RepID=A0AAP0K668_9MAGN